jgi:hypothetical protein
MYLSVPGRFLPIGQSRCAEPLSRSRSASGPFAAIAVARYPRCVAYSHNSTATSSDPPRLSETRT